MRRRFTGKRSILTLTVAGVFAAAGVASATIPDSGGVIHSCYDSSGGLFHPSGALRVLDTGTGTTCAKHEKALNFNQTGPQGPQGQQGLKGDQGDLGAPGPGGSAGQQGPQGPKGDAGGVAALLAAESESPQTVLPPSGTHVVLATKQIPAGSYLVIGNLQLMTFGMQAVECELRSRDKGGLTTGALALPRNAELGKTFSSLTLTHSLTTNGGAVTLECYVFDPQATSSIVNARQLELLQVGAVQ